MNQPRANRKGRPQPHRAPRRRPAELWRVVDELPAVEPIAPPDQPGALLRSLGDPPLGHGETTAGYFEAVIGRAADLAAALALTADLLAEPPAS
jgi:hypothetical protein